MARGKKGHMVKVHGGGKKKGRKGRGRKGRGKRRGRK